MLGIDVNCNGKDGEIEIWVISKCEGIYTETIKYEIIRKRHIIFFSRDCYAEIIFPGLQNSQDYVDMDLSSIDVNKFAHHTINITDEN